jgi:hypothetical protein
VQRSPADSDVQIPAGSNLPNTSKDGFGLTLRQAKALFRAARCTLQHQPQVLTPAEVTACVQALQALVLALHRHEEAR